MNSERKEGEIETTQQTNADSKSFVINGTRFNFHCVLENDTVHIKANNTETYDFYSANFTPSDVGFRGSVDKLFNLIDSALTDNVDVIQSNLSLNNALTDFSQHTSDDDDSGEICADNEHSASAVTIGQIQIDVTIDQPFLTQMYRLILPWSGRNEKLKSMIEAQENHIAQFENSHHREIASSSSNAHNIDDIDDIRVMCFDRLRIDDRNHFTPDASPAPSSCGDDFSNDFCNENVDDGFNERMATILTRPTSIFDDALYILTGHRATDASDSE